MAPALGPARESPAENCALCPRLVAYRQHNRLTYPDWHNRPVPSFGGTDVALLIVGLAPGLRGANRTGRPFTGDFAGDLLYDTLSRFGLSAGEYGKNTGDGLTLRNCRITNAVRCVPPKNKPTGAEATACRPFLIAEIRSLAHLRVILAVGAVAHRAVVGALGRKQKALPFGHGACHRLDGRLDNPLTLIDSYHCSRYNTNTGRLTAEMFHAVFRQITAILKD